MDLTKTITDMIEPTLTDMGFDLVRVSYGGGETAVLQIMAEREDGTMNVADCAKVSRAIAALMDVEDPISGRYTLEVSSPGMERPMVRLKDYERFAGQQVRLVLHEAYEGQRKFKGKILGVTEDELVAIETEAGYYEMALDAIEKAKLEIADDVFAASKAKKKT